MTGVSVYVIGYSHGTLTITQNGDIVSTRWSSLTDVSTALAVQRDNEKVE